MKRDLLWAATVIFVFIMGGVGQSGGQEAPASPLLDERFCTDASGDGKLDITDAVTILQYLFQGTTTPYCIAQGEPAFVTRAEFEGLTAEFRTLQKQSADRLQAVWGTYDGDGTNRRLIETGIETGRIVGIWISDRCADSAPENCSRRSYLHAYRSSPDMAPRGVAITGTDFVVDALYENDGDRDTGPNMATLEYSWFAIVSH